MPQGTDLASPTYLAGLTDSCVALSQISLGRCPSTVQPVFPVLVFQLSRHPLVQALDPPWYRYTISPLIFQVSQGVALFPYHSLRIYPYPMVWPLPRPWSETMVSIPLWAQKTLEIKGFLGLEHPFWDLVSQTPRPRGRGRPLFADLSIIVNPRLP